MVPPSTDGLRFFDVGPKVSPTTYRAAHRRSLLEVCRDVTAKGLGEQARQIRMD